MTSVLEPDLCVIGAGAGGLWIASAAVAMGAEVVLVERDRFGGAWASAGLAAEALVSAAAVAGTAQRLGDFGIDAPPTAVDLPRVLARVRERLDRSAPEHAAARYRAMGIRVIEAAGRFTNRRQLDAGGFQIRARRFVVSTGASPVLPPVPGIETIRAFFPATILDMTERPQHLLVLVGGSTGLSLAQAFRRLGSDVTVVDAGPMLAEEDPELADVVLRGLRMEGLRLWSDASVARIDPHAGGLALHIDGAHAPLLASHLLVATGRRPTVDGLGLEVAGVGFDRGGIRTRRDQRTGNRRIYAVGDVTGGQPSVQAAVDQARRALRSAILRQGPGRDRGGAPRFVRTDPEIATVGLTEAQARGAGIRVSVLRSSLADTDRARAGRRTDGHVKVVCDPRGAVLGAGIVGPQAGELIGLWQLAVQTGTHVGEVAEVVLPCPTLAEASTRAAALSLAPTLRSPRLKRVLRWLRLLG